ncbi:MAG: nuclear transport factor 2 family protein [Acidimicrobiaceae bacterium]|nr:nuclear transport factor 2 family protein [Acidimicrobiaceae bacterium]MYG98303.1 nuclear transport factor 2 family protein [Acidimicrobiaceae bacterium]MYL05223.1 nuclear transport factor 2 family protein [Acidimicrobiaceae bacterium]
MTIQDRLAETIEYVALQRLQSRYADVVTRRAWDELAGMVRPGCPIVVDVRHRQFELTGPAQYGEFIARQIERFSLFEFVLLNTVMHIDAPAGVAAARVYMQEIRQNVSDGRRTDAYGVYHDRLERDDDGRWWFAKRHYQSLARTAEPRIATDYDVFDVPGIALKDILNDGWGA